MTPDVARLAPEMHVVYRSAFRREPPLPFAPLVLAHFLAQCCHETAGLTKLQESLYFTSPERLMTVWPKRFRTRDSAMPFVRNPQAVAEVVYGGRMGNTQRGDGWKFIGRGLLQITGRAMYREVGTFIGVDLEAQPELAALEAHAVPVAVAVWFLKGCTDPAEADDLAGVTQRINGGLVGFEDRRQWLVRAKAVLGLKEAA